MPSRLGGILKGSQYLSTASPLTPWIFGIIGFCNIQVKIGNKPPEYLKIVFSLTGFP
jgi:hypothetical protein